MGIRIGNGEGIMVGTGKGGGMGTNVTATLAGIGARATGHMGAGFRVGTDIGVGAGTCTLVLPTNATGTIAMIASIDTVIASD